MKSALAVLLALSFVTVPIRAADAMRPREEPKKPRPSARRIVEEERNSRTRRPVPHEQNARGGIEKTGPGRTHFR